MLPINMIKICLAALKPEKQKKKHAIGVCQQNPGRQSSCFKEMTESIASLLPFD